MSEIINKDYTKIINFDYDNIKKILNKGEFDNNYKYNINEYFLNILKIFDLICNEYRAYFKESEIKYIYNNLYVKLSPKIISSIDPEHPQYSKDFINNKNILEINNLNKKFEIALKYVYTYNNVESFKNYLYDLSYITEINSDLVNFPKYSLYNLLLEEMVAWDRDLVIQYKKESETNENERNNEIIQKYIDMYYNWNPNIENEYLNKYKSYNGGRYKNNKKQVKPVKKSKPKYTKCNEHYIIGARKYCIYLGSRGAKYIKKNKKHINIKSLYTLEDLK